MSRNEQKRRRRWAKEGYGANPLCYLCWKSPATTDDHVPPRGFSSSTTPASAYRLPTCLACNGALTRDEEYLRNVLAGSGLNREASRVLEATFRALQGSSRLYPFNNATRLFKNATVRDVYSPGGIWLGSLPSFDVNLDRIDRVVVKIVKGLHFRHHKAPLPSDATFEVMLWAPHKLIPSSPGYSR